MPKASHAFSLFAGRSLLALAFLLGGVGKLFAWDAVVGFLAMCEIPWPGFFLAGAVALELAGSLSLMLGWRTRSGAKALMVVLIPATLTYHNFWAVPPEEVREQVLQFLKNLSILGGLLLVLVHGAGPWSVDERKKKAALGSGSQPEDGPAPVEDKHLT